MPRDNANSHIVHGIDRKYVSVSSYHGHESSVHVHLHGLQSSSGSEILLEQGADFGREAIPQPHSSNSHSLPTRVSSKQRWIS